MKKKLLVLVAFLGVFFGTTLTTNASVEAKDVKIYRLYNPGLKEHLYTSDANEKDVLYANAGWGYEGVAWYAPSKGKPVYRLYSPQLRNHLYTTDKNEVKVLTSQYGWTKDNGGKHLFYSGGKTGIYRLYNAKLNGMHMLTTDKNEYKILSASIWDGEGVKLNASKVGNPITTKYKNPPTASTPAPAPVAPATPSGPTTSAGWTTAEAGYVYARPQSMNMYHSVTNPQNYNYMTEAAARAAGYTPPIRGNAHAQW